MQQAYIDSGILETYVLGCASNKEVEEVLYMAEQYPEIRQALLQLENDIEVIATGMAVTPPDYLWPKIEQQIEEIALRGRVSKPAIYKPDNAGKEMPPASGQQFIPIEAESTHMRVHKVWRWIFVAVFVLGKVFLGFAIYYFVQSVKADRQIEKMQTELRQLKK